MANPGDFAYTVKQQADIVRIVGDYVKLRKSGAQNFSGLCPFHGEKSPSFSVHATRQFFHCFGCGVSGDVFSFVQRIESITFPEAVRAVAQKLGIPLPKQQFNSPAEAHEARIRTVLMDMHQRACEFFEEQLRRPEAAKAREYLASRGLNDDIIRKFRIGHAPDTGFALRDVLKANFDEELLRESGLMSWKQDGGEGHKPGLAQMYSKFRNRITFPIANESGRVIAFTGRTLATDDKSGPKYLNSPETPIYQKSRVLYNLDRAKEAIRKLEYAILVEGQMDCIAVFTAGFQNVIASSGTAFTEHQVRLLGRFSKNIVVNFDPDTAGANAAERSLAMLVAEEFSIKMLTLEPGLDPDLFVRRKGAQAYAGALMNAPTYFEWLIDRARMLHPVNSAEGKVKALNYLLPHIQRVPNRIQRDELVLNISQKLNIDSAVLRQELKHAISSRATRMNAPAQAQVTQAERIVLRALAAPAAGTGQNDFDLRRQAQYALRSDALHQGLPTEALMEAALAVIENAEEGGPELDAADPMQLPVSETDRRILAETLMREDEELTPELLHGAVESLRCRSFERRLREIDGEMASAGKRNDMAAQAQLAAEKMKVKSALDHARRGTGAIVAR